MADMVDDDDGKVSGAKLGGKDFMSHRFISHTNSHVHTTFERRRPPIRFVGMTQPAETVVDS